MTGPIAKAVTEAINAPLADSDLWRLFLKGVIKDSFWIPSHIETACMWDYYEFRNRRRMEDIVRNVRYGTLRP